MLRILRYPAFKCLSRMAGGAGPYDTDGNLRSTADTATNPVWISVDQPKEREYK
jgi:hypothetical protein